MSAQTSEVRQTLALWSARPGYFVGKNLEETHAHLAKAIRLSVIGQFTILTFQNVLFVRARKAVERRKSSRSSEVLLLCGT